MMDKEYNIDMIIIELNKLSTKKIKLLKRNYGK